MDETPFDAWTRRRFGLATGSFLAAAIGLSVTESVEAKHQKTRCKKTQTKCGKKCVKGTCCPGQGCGTECTCDRTVEGDAVCTPTAVKLVPCTTSKDCDPGQRCVALGQRTCVPLCLG
jgi:hypothetical protein